MPTWKLDKESESRSTLLFHFHWKASLREISQKKGAFIQPKRGPTGPAYSPG